MRTTCCRSVISVTAGMAVLPTTTSVMRILRYSRILSPAESGRRSIFSMASPRTKSDIQPDTLHGDTQAQSTPVYGLAFLLGIKLMPRIRNWKDLKWFRPTTSGGVPEHR